jgi:hypothetical protein
VTDQASAHLFCVGDFALKQLDQPMVFRFPRGFKPGSRMIDFVADGFQLKPTRRLQRAPPFGLPKWRHLKTALR